jgi:hypothetical protein
LVRKAADKLKAGVAGEANLFAEFAEHRVPATLASLLTTTGKSPPIRIAKLHKHDLPLGRERDALNSDGAWAGEEPDESSQILKTENAEM